MLKNRIKSFGYAFKGIATVFRSEPNAKIHLLATGLVIGAGLYFGITPLDWALIGIAICAVWAAEAFNTSLEELTNLVSPDYHPQAGKAKDTAAAGVLLTAFGALVIGIYVFLPHLRALFA